MQAQQGLPPLTHSVVHTSSVIASPVEEVWAAVRGFGSIARWSAPLGLERISSDLLTGSVEGQVGALRHVRLGELGFVEQLEALDDDRMLIKWRVVSHPMNANPFPGSLLNYKAKLRLYDVTVKQKTFMQLECAFETEHENGEVMKKEIKARQEANIRGLISLMEVSKVLRAEQLAVPLQPSLAPQPNLAPQQIPAPQPVQATLSPLGVSPTAPGLSPRAMGRMASEFGVSGPASDYMVAPIASGASSLASTGWGSSLESAVVVHGQGSGMSQQDAQTHAAQAHLAQVPPLAASMHDSAATVQSVDMGKALQQAQAQAQAQGMGSQLARLNARLQQQQQQQAVLLGEVQRPAFKSSAAIAGRPMGSNSQLLAPMQNGHFVPSRASDDLLVAQRRPSEPDSLSASSRVLSM